MTAGDNSTTLADPRATLQAFALALNREAHNLGRRHEFLEFL